MKSNAPPKNKARSRVWLAVVYDLDKINEVDMLAYSRITGFLCSPLHDKDVYPMDIVDKETNEIIHKKGDLKQPHFHLIIKFANPISFSGAKYEVESFITTQNVRVEIAKDICDSIDYLTHYGFDDKYPYHKDNLSNSKFGDCSYFDKVTNRSDDNYQFLADLMSLSPYEMAVRYGRDYIRNYDKYRKFANMVANEDNLPNESERFKEWLKVYQPDFEFATIARFREFEKINGMFL